MAISVREMEERRRRKTENLYRLEGKVSRRTKSAIGRIYLFWGFEVPINKATDEELLQFPGIGEKTLAEVRRAFSYNIAKRRLI